MIHGKGLEKSFLSTWALTTQRETGRSQRWRPELCALCCKLYLNKRGKGKANSTRSHPIPCSPVWAPGAEVRVKHGRKPPAGSGTLALQKALEIQQLRLQVRNQAAYLWPLSPVTKRKGAKGIKQEFTVDRMCWFPSHCLSSVPLICSEESLRAQTPPCWPMKAELSSSAPSPLCHVSPQTLSPPPSVGPLPVLLFNSQNTGQLHPTPRPRHSGPAAYEKHSLTEGESQYHPSAFFCPSPSGRAPRDDDRDLGTVSPCPPTSPPLCSRPPFCSRSHSWDQQ